MIVEDLSGGVRKLEAWARVAKLSIYVWLAFQMLGFGFQARFLLGAQPDATLLEASDLLEYTTIAVFLGSAVAILFWIHRAHENLRLFAAGPFNFSGQSAAFWFFVPFANLVQPFRAMRELWRESRGPAEGDSRSTALVDSWWACFIIGGLISNISARMLDGAVDSDARIATLMVFDFGLLLRICSAILLHEIIRAVGRMQLKRVSVGEVFA